MIAPNIIVANPILNAMFMFEMVDIQLNIGNAIATPTHRIRLLIDNIVAL